MAGSNTAMIKKLQTAINKNGGRILYSTSQFYLENYDRVVTKYHIKQVIKDDITGKIKYDEIFNACSQIQIVLFLRDFLYDMQGKEIPHNNPIWEKCKEEYKLKNEKFG